MASWGGSEPQYRVPSTDDDAVATLQDRGTFAAISDQLRPSQDIDVTHSVPGERQRTGTAHRLDIPADSATVRDLNHATTYPISGPTELPEGEFLLSVRTTNRRNKTDDPAVVSVRFPGPASLEPGEDLIGISFWTPSPVTVGVDAAGEGVPATLSVEPTPSAFARGLSAMAAAHRTRGPARSYPAFRDHPPLIRIGSETDIPDAVASQSQDAPLTMTVPPDFATLFVSAPLAYYLGATVEVEDCATPRLAADGETVYSFVDPPSFQFDCAGLLRRVFYLDCQVRGVASCRDLESHELAGQVGSGLAHLREQDIAARLRHYLDLPAETVEAGMPEWHLAAYVEPDPAHMSAIPHLLDRISLIYRPESTPVSNDDLLDSTLSDAYPARGETNTVDDVIKPELHAGLVHAWLADGTPINAFKLTDQSLRNRRSLGERHHERMQLTAVLNDEAMGTEHSQVADIYRDRAESLPIDVTVHDHLSPSELAGVFERETDFVHFIGHCDEGGLRCPGGHLSVGGLDCSRARTFFLNACGSYDQGRRLIDKGSITGAATFRSVLDKQAARVGTTFARLLVHGFSFERALSLARRRILTGKDYAVVGDGTYALLPSPKQPAVVRLRASDNDLFSVTCEVVDARTNGARYATPFETTPTLNGRRRERELTREAVRRALSRASVPVVYDGDLHWSAELAETL
jgi:hypothetical protein